MWVIFTKQWWIDDDPDQCEYGRRCNMQQRDRRSRDVDGMTAARPCVLATVITIVAIAITKDGHWFALPFSCAALVLLRLSWCAGSIRRETPLVLAAFALGYLAVSMSGVLG